MKIPNCVAQLTETAKRRVYLCNLLLVVAFLSMAVFVGTPNSYREKVLSGWRMSEYLQNANTRSCKVKPLGSESLPQGIISRKSNLEMWATQGFPRSSKTKNQGVQKASQRKASKSLLAVPVGIKQKKVVNQIVNKFYASNFTVMLFHYDGIVDEWRDLQWSDSALHVSAINQTKWWFAKRFLHPDIVADYDYIFLWDEDLGVEHFDPGRYISIIQREGLQISQPALDTANSEVHHQITARGRRGDVHRRIFKSKSVGGCDENSTAPPCTGWVEMMAPAFSRTAWRCVWHMIQNDLIHAWGLDMKLGYCVQGDRSKYIGVVDSEYIVHMGIPTLGGADENKTNTETNSHSIESEQSYSRKMVPPESGMVDRYAIRRRSYAELMMFQDRWKRAVVSDKCWNDPYPGTP